MRYLILLCFLFFSSVSYAIIPSESPNTSIPAVKKESKSKKESKKQQKIERKADKKQKRQLKKQSQKLKWQLLKSAFKAHKATKKLYKKNKKDRKPVYWASWVSALLGVIGQILFRIGIGVSGVYFLGFLLAMTLGLAAFVLAIKSIRFLKKNPKDKNDTYNRTWSIIFTVIGMYFGIAFFFLLIFLLLFSFFIIA